MSHVVRVTTHAVAAAETILEENPEAIGCVVIVAVARGPDTFHPVAVALGNGVGKRALWRAVEHLAGLEVAKPLGPDKH